MKWQTSPRTLAVMSKLHSAMSEQPLRAAQAGDEMLSAPCVPASSVAQSRRMRRLADWLLSMIASDGMSERLAAERRRDADLVRRVARRRRLLGR